MGYMDIKISRIRSYNKASGRHERMKKLVARKSAQQVTTTKTENAREESLKNYMNWKLKIAVEVGDVESFITTLEEVCSEQESQPDTFLQQRDHKGNTYLHVAAEYGNSELIGFLMHVSGYGELLKLTNKKGDNALHTSVKAGHFAVTDLLLRRGKESFAHLVTQKNEKGNLPLHEALIHNHQHLVGLLLHWEERFCSFHVNNEGKSALYLTVEAGNVKTFNAILKVDHLKFTYYQNEVEECLIRGKSIIHAAISLKDEVMLQEILAKGMHMLVHFKDENGQSPLELASTIGFKEGEDILCDELSKDTTDSCVVIVNQQEIEYNPVASLSSFSDEKGVILSPDWDSRHERMLKLLENVMPSQKQQKQLGKCHRCMDLRLYEAARKGDVDEFISALEQYSVETNLTLPAIISQLTPMKKTFLHVAVTRSNKDLVWLIIQYFPSLLVRTNSHGNTSLHLAAEVGRIDIVKIFVTIRNEKLRKEIPIETNLHINDATYIMKEIMENDDGRTPLQLALQCYKSDAAEFMIKENVEEAYYVNKKGTSALYVALLNGQTERMKNILSTVSHYADQKFLDGQLMKGKSLLLAALLSKKIGNFLILYIAYLSVYTYRIGSIG